MALLAEKAVLPGERVNPSQHADQPRPEPTLTSDKTIAHTVTQLEQGEGVAALLGGGRNSKVQLCTSM